MTMESYIPLERLEDGTPVILSGGDYYLPGPDGKVWLLSAATGSIYLKDDAVSRERVGLDEPVCPFGIPRSDHG